MKQFDTERADFARLTGASHEALAKLDHYADLLKEWQGKFNLVAPSTLTAIWSRHFLDSAQLFPLIKSNDIVYDLGSGAGFPGLVLSILGIEHVHLVESTGKKADFLAAVIAQLGLKAIVHLCRVEELKNVKADIITARALAPLSELLSLAAPLLKKDGFCLFLKGQKVDVELTEAKKYWMFDASKTPSLSDPSGSVLTIRNLRKDVKSKLPAKSHGRKLQR